MKIFTTPDLSTVYYCHIDTVKELTVSEAKSNRIEIFFNAD